MTNKTFAERFNRELAQFGLPEEKNEKLRAMAKVFKISGYLANEFILGHSIPTDEQLEKIASVLDVCPQWLCGKTEKKKSVSRREVTESE